MIIPKHEWDGTKLRLQKSNGEMGDWIDLRGPPIEEKTYVTETVDIPAAIKQIIDSLPAVRHGQDGVDGKIGKDGRDGDAGLGVYELWLSLGHTGTEEDFFAWLITELAKRLYPVIPGQSDGAGPLTLRLNNLRDVDTEGANDGDVLTYRDGAWHPEAGGGGGGAVNSVNGQTGNVIIDYLDFQASTASESSMNIAAGIDPTAPEDGDVWNDGTNLKYQQDGTTYRLPSATGFSKITVGTTEPDAPQMGDVWIDTN